LRFGSLAKHDPFDRLILAQASASGAKLVTADTALLSLNLDFILDAEN
jgi:PIN domain nuclease of toxin-antitoxin system